MKKLRNKKICTIIGMIMILASVFSISAFAEENEAVDVAPKVITQDVTVSPLGIINPSCPFIYQTTFLFNGTSPYETFEGGNNVVISASATDQNGNSVSGATIHVELCEYSTGNTVASLNSTVDGEATVAYGSITPGGSYCFEYTSDMLHMDTWFTVRLVAVVY